MTTTQQTFFNTLNLSGQDLQVAKIETKNQNEVIKLIFTKYPEQEFTPNEVYSLTQRSGYKYLLTSCRRSITTLEKQGVLIKTNHKKQGGYGKPNYCWKLAAKY